MIRRLLDTLEILGRFIVFLWDILCSIPKRPFRISRYISEIEQLGVNSFLIIFASGGVIGMLFTQQVMSFLQSFNVEIAVGATVAVSFSRELAPVVTTLMVISKNGSAMAAELGTMKITEQIDALESMSINVVQYLVLPKVVASLLVFPFLTILANVIGIVGSYLCAVYLYFIDSAGFIDYMLDYVRPQDIISGLIKAGIMGIITAVICCFIGLRTTAGARGVGRSTTMAVVVSSITILVADFILSELLDSYIYS